MNKRLAPRVQPTCYIVSQLGIHAGVDSHYDSHLICILSTVILFFMAGWRGMVERPRRSLPHHQEGEGVQLARLQEGFPQPFRVGYQEVSRGELSQKKIVIACVNEVDIHFIYM